MRMQSMKCAVALITADKSYAHFSLTVYYCTQYYVENIWGVFLHTNEIEVWIAYKSAWPPPFFIVFYNGLSTGKLFLDGEIVIKKMYWCFCLSTERWHVSPDVQYILWTIEAHNHLSGTTQLSNTTASSRNNPFSNAFCMLCFNTYNSVVWKVKYMYLYVEGYTLNINDSNDSMALLWARANGSNQFGVVCCHMEAPQQLWSGFSNSLIA